MFDLISIGDVAIDHFCKIHDAHLALGVDKLRRELCISYGDKLSIELYCQTLGGNNGNNAVGATRLGLKTAAYLNIGTDPAGRQAIDELKKMGVDTRYVVVNQGWDSNVSILVSFQGERTILVYQQPWQYRLPELDRTRWVYVSSMAQTFRESEIMNQISSYLERIGASLVFNPGTYQLEPGLKKFAKVLSMTTLLVVNKEEAELILRMSKEKKTEVKRLLKGLADLGSKMVIITDGKEGSCGFDGEKFYKLAAFSAEVVDMTGAGDAYATGVLAGLFYGHNLSSAMRWGAANGASVVEEIGAQAGLLTYDKIQAKLRENSKIIAKEI